jgi:hypothetical protein
MSAEPVMHADKLPDGYTRLMTQRFETDQRNSARDITTR